MPVTVTWGLPLASVARTDLIEMLGADGIHSVVRPAVGGADAARFSGSVAYRALVPRERVEDLPVETTNRVGPDSHV